MHNDFFVFFRQKKNRSFFDQPLEHRLGVC